jgi:hypothetical protein
MTTVQEYTPMAYSRQGPFGAPNGLRLSGAHMRVRCSRGLGDRQVQTGYMVYRLDREHG